MAASYSRETTRELLTSYISGSITEAEFRRRLAEMNVPQSGIDTMIEDASRLRAAARGGASTPSSGGSSGAAWVIVLLLLAAAAAGYYFFLR